MRGRISQTKLILTIWSSVSIHIISFGAQISKNDYIGAVFHTYMIVFDSIKLCDYIWRTLMYQYIWLYILISIILCCQCRHAFILIWNYFGILLRPQWIKMQITNNHVIGQEVFLQRKSALQQKSVNCQSCFAFTIDEFAHEFGFECQPNGK